MKGKPLIGVFTPTYNRVKELRHCYESLKKQPSKNFEWYIIDDGSSDNTEELIKQWIQETREFKITYHYKENGGLHTAYNKAIEVIDNELCMCIDSDDWLTDNAIELIENIWGSIDRDKYVGIMGLDQDANEKIIGDAFPAGIQEMYLHEKLVQHQLDGDKKMVHRTALLKKVEPMPSFKGEKFFNPSYLMYEVDKFGPLFVTNKCLCIVDYQPDGMSSDMVGQYVSSPNSYAEIRKQYLSFPNLPLSFVLRQYVHLTSSYILASRYKEVITGVPNPFIGVISFPLGLMLAAWLKLKYTIKDSG